MLDMLRSRSTSLNMNFNSVEIEIAKHIWLNDYYYVETYDLKSKIILRNTTDLLLTNVQHDRNFDLKGSHQLVYKQ